MRITKSILLLVIAVGLPKLMSEPAHSNENETDVEIPKLLESINDEQLKNYQQFCASQGHKEWRLEEENGEIVIYCYE